MSIGGILLESYAYTPFGGNISMVSAHVGFSSEATENLLRINYYNYRYYSFRVGKWLSRDKLQETYEYNKYSICSNNIINNYDMLGNMSDKSCRTINNIMICWGKLDNEDMDIGSGRQDRSPVEIYGFIAAPPSDSCECYCNNKIIKNGTYFLSQKKRKYKSSKEWELDGDNRDYLDGGKKANNYGGGAYVDAPGTSHGKEPIGGWFRDPYRMDFKIELWCRCPPHMGGERFTGNSLQFHFRRYYKKRSDLHTLIDMEFY